MKKTVVIGITSGIAAYKAIELIQILKSEGITVKAIMTHSATKMLSIKEVEEATGTPVFVDLFEKDFDYKKVLQIREVDHIQVADSADLMVIVPATANSIAKIAHGLADDFLTTTVLAVTAPVLVCPSMNVHMWNNPVVQDNVEKLKKNGYLIVEPVEGMLACGYEGKGRLEDITIIKDEILQQLQLRDSLKGKKIIVTAGGTSERIDDARVITNRSSGKMGIAIAKECYRRGADVLLLRAESTSTVGYGITEETFSTPEDLSLLIEKNVGNYDVIFHAAAVSDFSIEQHIGKLPSTDAHTVTLKPREKIVNKIKEINPNIFLVAFKAESEKDEGKLVVAAEKKLQEANADAVVVNDISRKDRGFASDTNEVFVVLKKGESVKIPLQLKSEVAKSILNALFNT